MACDTHPRLEFMSGFEGTAEARARATCTASVAIDHSITGRRRSKFFALRNPLFNRLVRDGEELGRHVDVKQPSRLHVNDELEPDRLHHR
jgi:hypothetical protein